MRTKNKTTPSYDLDAYRRGVSRKMWTVIVTSLLTSVMSLAIAWAATTRNIPVIAFDSQGRPMLFEETIRPAFEVTKVRVEHFTLEFMKRLVGIDSTRLELDLQEALNMMSPRPREVFKRDGGEIERRLAYENGNVRSHFEELRFNISELGPDRHGDIYLWVWGRQVFEAIEGKLEEPIVQWVYGKFVLERVGVTRETPYGLLVKYFESFPFDTREALETELLKRSRSS